MILNLESHYTISESGCWIWKGAVHRAKHAGYGLVIRKGKRIFMHRWFYERFKGPIPDNLQIDHLCRVRACVNPDHLELVTSRENTLRGNGASAVNARKTHCPQGHAYSEENTYRRPNGNRKCRICKREAKRKARLIRPG